jgi:Protein of unknown function (DUF1214)
VCRAGSGRSSSTTAHRLRTRPSGRTTTWISTDLYFGPQAPAGKEHNWIETIPGKGWFPILRLYSPLQPFFDKSWRPSEIEPHNLGSNGHQPETGRRTRWPGQL